ncbi:hypothetical protein ACHWQZ_G001632 [Mnemiopsis leidyi]
MCDGEIILENSPLHQYLQEIGWDDTQTVARADAHDVPDPHNIPEHSAQSSSLQGLFSNIRQLVMTLVDWLLECGFRLKDVFDSPNQVDLSEIRNQAEPHLLSIHRDSLDDLMEMISGPSYVAPAKTSPNSNTPFRLNTPPFLYSAVIFLLLLLGLLFSFANTAMNTIIVILVMSSVTMYYYWTQQTRGRMKPPDDTISQYCSTIRTYKQLCKTMLSYLRDCQIAQTPFATGVTWSKLDNLEKESGGVLQSGEMRQKLFDTVRLVFVEHRNVVQEWLECAPLICEVDCVNRYICLQKDVEEFVDDLGSSAGLSSHTLRYYLKLVEHVSSEVLWRLIVCTFPGAWKFAKVDRGKLTMMLTSLHTLHASVTKKESELRGYYEKHNNSDINKAVLVPTVPNDSSTSQVLHQLQLLHSSLNIATIRCRDVHSLLSHNSTHDISPTLSLIKLNVDLASTTLQTLASLTETDTTTSAHPPLQPTGTELTLQEGKEATPIIPYRQQGNMVFTGVNDGKDPDTVGGLDSDDELELELHRHKPESKMMLAELRHVIESNPTCLYEDDYEEFKQTGLLNPTESELKEMYENRSDSEHSDKDEQTKGSGLAPQRIGFNPFSLPFPSQPFSSVPGQFPPSLFAEMEVCEAYGDLSEEEENGEEGNCEEFQEKGEQHEGNFEEFQERSEQHEGNCEERKNSHPQLEMTKHPCQSWACSLQTCLAKYQYKMDKCEGVIDSLIVCCADNNTLSGPCEGFKDRVESVISYSNSNG